VYGACVVVVSGALCVVVSGACLCGSGQLCGACVVVVSDACVCVLLWSVVHVCVVVVRFRHVQSTTTWIVCAGWTCME